METRSPYRKLLFADNLHRTTYQNLSRYLLILNKWRFTLDYLSMATVYIISARACKLSDGNAIHYRSDQISVAAAEGTRNISILIDKIHLCKENGRNLKIKLKHFVRNCYRNSRFAYTLWYTDSEIHYISCSNCLNLWRKSLKSSRIFFFSKLFFFWIRHSTSFLNNRCSSNKKLKNVLPTNYKNFHHT